MYVQVDIRFANGRSAPNQRFKIKKDNQQVEEGKIIETNANGQKTQVVTTTKNSNQIVFSVSHL